MRVIVYLLIAILATALPSAADPPALTPEQQAFGAWLATPIPSDAPDPEFATPVGAGLDANLQGYAPSVEVLADVAKKGSWLVRAKVRHARTGVLLETVTPRGLFAGGALAQGAPVYALELQTPNAGPVTAWCAPQLNNQGLGKFVVGACMYQDERGRAYFVQGDAGMSGSLFTTSFNPGARPLERFPGIEERRVSFETPLALVASLVDVDRDDVDISLFVLGAGQMSFVGQLHPRRSPSGGFAFDLLGKSLRFEPTTVRNEFQLVGPSP